MPAKKTTQKAPAKTPAKTTVVRAAPTKSVPIRNVVQQGSVLTVDGKPRMRVSPKRSLAKTGTALLEKPTVVAPALYPKKGVRRAVPLQKEVLVDDEQVVPVRAVQKPTVTRAAARPAPTARPTPKVAPLPPALPARALAANSGSMMQTGVRTVSTLGIVVGIAAIALGIAMMALPAATLLTLKSMLGVSWLSGVTTAFLDWRLGTIATDLITATAPATLSRIATDPVIAIPVAASGRSLLLLGVLIGAASTWLGYMLGAGRSRD